MNSADSITSVRTENCFPCKCLRFLWNKEAYANNRINLQTLRSAAFAQELSLIGDTCNNKDSPGQGAWLLDLPHLLPLLHSLLSPPIFCNSVTIRVNKRCVYDPIKQFASSCFVMKF